MAETKYIGFRISKNFVAELDELGEIEKKSKSAVIRDVFEMGIEEKRKELAIELYKKGEASLERAAKLAKLSLSDFIDFIESKKVPRDMDVENIKKLLLEELGAEV